jgi:DNA-binding LacI/PurR family transcriptional regulator
MGQGVVAAATLLQLMKEPDSGPRRVLMPTELIVRRSTAGPVAPST